MNSYVPNKYEKLCDREFEIMSYNEKYLEFFANSNYKTRLLLYDLIYAYTNNNKNEMRKHYNAIIEKLKKIETFSNHFTKKMEFPLTHLYSNITFKNYNQYLMNKNKDLKESNHFQKAMTKLTFINTIFKNLFDLEEDGIIRDFIKENHQLQRKGSILSSPPLILSHFLQDIDNFEGIISDLKAQFPKLKIIYKEDKRDIRNTKQLNLIIKVDVAFRIFLSLVQDDKALRCGKINVVGKKERFNNSLMNVARENRILPGKLKKSENEKSKILLFRKMNMLLEDRMNNLIKGKIGQKKHIYSVLTYFLVSRNSID